MSCQLYESSNWPADPAQLSDAREFLRSIAAKDDNRPVLIIPDRDVDGLTSGAIIHRVISRVILEDRKLNVLIRFVPKGSWLGDPSEKADIDMINPRYCCSSRFGLNRQSCYCIGSGIQGLPSIGFKCASSHYRSSSLVTIPSGRGNMFGMQSHPRSYNISIDVYCCATIPCKCRTRNTRRMQMACGIGRQRRPWRYQMGSAFSRVIERPCLKNIH